jgi:hypothetical protein
MMTSRLVLDRHFAERYSGPDEKMGLSNAVSTVW